VLKKIVVHNYRLFRDFTLEFQPGMNILVGDNGIGKSSVLETVNLALTGRVQNRQLAQDLSPYAFNLEVTADYIQALKDGKNPTPPEMIIDLYLDTTGASAMLKGTNNSTSEDACGLRFRAFYNSEFDEEYKEFVKKPDAVHVIPSEYYRCEWLGFSGNSVTPRSVPATASMIDASSIRLQSGADYYLQGIIGSNLTPVERVELTRAYRSLREGFADNESITAINDKLKSTPGDVSDRELTLGVDISQRASWESSLVPHLDNLPFTFVGKGEQSSLKILLALNRKVDNAHIILVEEPENHLSFSRMNMLITKILEKCQDRQVLLTTHSSYVLNKLGLEQLVLLSTTGGVRLSGLTPGTQDYFRKLSGYDTLRLILAQEAILVEGPSDELIVQRAYSDVHGVLPIQSGIDVINLRGLSFKRFLEIASPLKRKTTVVTDNDGKDPAAVAANYDAFTSQEHITVHVGGAGSSSLEPHLLAANDRAALNAIFGTIYATDDELVAYMVSNKTTCALAIFESDTTINMPQYIKDAVT
jgi:ABC-type cobalamin/Fe3+-siderophores transport system ATPase subunit